MGIDREDCLLSSRLTDQNAIASVPLRCNRSLDIKAAKNIPIIHFFSGGLEKKTNSISIWRAATSVTEAESLEETWEPPSAFHTVFLPLSPALISVIIALPVIQWGSETEERGGYIQK